MSDDANHSATTYSRNGRPLFSLGLVLLLLGFCHKQTMAVAAAIPFFSILFDRSRPLKDRMAWGLAPIASLLLTAAALKLWLPIHYLKAKGADSVVSPEDPTVPLYASGRPTRSIYLEGDANGWPKTPTPGLVAELSSADPPGTQGWPSLAGHLG